MAPTGAEAHGRGPSSLAKDRRPYELWLLSDRVLLVRPERHSRNSLSLLRLKADLPMANLTLSWRRPTLVGEAAGLEEAIGESHRADREPPPTPGATPSGVAGGAPAAEGGDAASTSFWLCLEDAVFTGTAPIYNVIAEDAHLAAQLHKTIEATQAENAKMVAKEQERVQHTTKAAARAAPPRGGRSGGVQPPPPPHAAEHTHHLNEDGTLRRHGRRMSLSLGVGTPSFTPSFGFNSFVPSSGRKSFSGRKSLSGRTSFNSFVPSLSIRGRGAAAGAGGGAKKADSSGSRVSESTCESSACNSARCSAAAAGSAIELACVGSLPSTSAAGSTAAAAGSAATAEGAAGPTPSASDPSDAHLPSIVERDTSSSSALGGNGGERASSARSQQPRHLSAIAPRVAAGVELPPMPMSPSCSTVGSAVSLALPPPPPPLECASQESFALSEPSVSFAPDVRESVALPPAPGSRHSTPASPWHRLTTSIDRDTLTILSRKASSGTSPSLRVASSLGPLRSRSGLFSSSSSAADIRAESDSEDAEEEDDDDDVLIQQSDYIRMIADLRKTRVSGRTQEEPLDDDDLVFDADGHADADAEPPSSDLTEDDEPAPPSEQPRLLASERV